MESNNKIRGQSVDFDPFTNGLIQRKIEATDAQKEIWTSVQFGSEANCAFNESLWLELTGSLDVVALETAFQDVVARHEALRATFSPDGQFFCISAMVVPDIGHEDLSALPAAEQANAVSELQRQAATTPFDLVNGPLLRLLLVKLEDQHYGLLVTTHHIVCDGWSYWIFLEDLAALYNMRKNNTALSLPAVDSFSQYAEEMNSSRYRDQFDEDLQYWLKQFSPLPEPLALPTYEPRPLHRTFAARRLDYSFDDLLIASVQKLAASLGITFNSVLLSCLSCYLHRICQQEDIVIGVPAAGQSVSGLYHLIGHCINLLPLHYHVKSDIRFSEYAKECQKNLLDGYEHQHITYGTLIRQLKLNREPGRPPLVSVIFNIDQDLDAVFFDGLEVSVYTPPRSFENFDLFFNLVKDKKGVTLECQYQTALFDEATISMHLDGLRELLEAVAENPQQLIGNIPIVAEGEKQFLLEQLNRNTLELPPVQSFVELFRQSVTENRGKTAAVYQDISLSYEELDRRSDQVAAYIHHIGGGKGSLVGIYLNRSLNMLIAALGVLKSGAGYVPLDPAFPHDRLQYMIEDSGLNILISEKTLDITAFSHTGQIIDIEADWSSIAACNTDMIQDISCARDSIGYVIYTSGSTGKPKGVAVPHGAILNFLVSMRQNPGMNHEDILLAVTTLSFDIAVLELYLPLISGATVVIAGTDDLVDGKRLMNILSNTGITVLQATPSTWRVLLASGWQGKQKLKALCGGEVLSQELADRLVSRVGELWNMYGPTETTVWSTVYRISGQGQRILIGRPIGNTQLYVLDAGQQLIPRGVTGELYIGGKGVTLGYLNRQELTDLAFVSNPLTRDKNDIVYRTGDLVRYRQDGELEYISRLDNQIKLRGYRIELGEIEAAISRFPDVEQVVVSVFVRSEDDQRLVAYIKGKKKPDFEALRVHLRETLPTYMIPQHFICLDDFPLTANGKVDRRALPGPVEEREAARGVVKSRNDFEKSLLAVWKKVLGVDDIGITDDFFEKGGHSLLALTLVNEMKKATGVEIEYGDIFISSTIKDLVESLGSKTRKQASSVVPLQKNGSATPLFCLCGINLYREFAHSLGENQPVYAIYADEEQALLKQAVQGEVGNVSVKKLADSYCKAILRQQAKGPYQLAGISFGGILAIETARLLEKKGEKVALVILLDTILKKGERKSRVDVLQHHLKNVREKGINYLLSKAKNRIGSEESGNQTEDGQDEHASIRIRELAYLQAMREYEEKIQPYMGDVVLVRAQKTFKGGAIEYLPAYGWEEHLQGSFTVIDVPGDHLGIITQPQVRVLAEKLKCFLTPKPQADKNTI